LSAGKLTNNDFAKYNNENSNSCFTFQKYLNFKKILIIKNSKQQTQQTIFLKIQNPPSILPSPDLFLKKFKKIPLTKFLKNFVKKFDTNFYCIKNLFL
jgi:hypothetical protein